MKSLLLLCLTLPVVELFAKENKWLKKEAAYGKYSYYKMQVYDEQSMASFYKLEAIRQAVEPDSLDIHLLNACLFYATNKLRALNNLTPFIIDEQLKNASATHSFQMAQHHFFDHTNMYESSLRTPEKRLSTFGIQYSYEGENCHRVYISEVEMTYIELAQQVIQSLYNSAPHRANMLNKKFKYGACAVKKEKKDSDLYLIVTQNFYANGTF